MTHWWITPALALAVVVAGALAATVELRAEEEATDACFRYGRFECCVRED